MAYKKQPPQSFDLRVKRMFVKALSARMDWIFVLRDPEGTVPRKFEEDFRGLVSNVNRTAPDELKFLAHRKFHVDRSYNGSAAPGDEDWTVLVKCTYGHAVADPTPAELTILTEWLEIS